MELLVSLAIMSLLLGAVLPSLSTAMMLEQHRAAKRISFIYAQLHDEAALRNRTFRLAYHVDEGFYDIEMGDPNSMIFEDAEKAEAGQEKEEDLREEMSDEELAAYKKANSWQKIDNDFDGHVVLPAGTRFGSIYTPQYKDPVVPTEFDKKAKKSSSKKGEEDGPRVVYSYIFSNGFSEYTVVTIVNVDDPKEGYTITVDPLSGKVAFFDEIKEERDLFKNLPEEGPRLN